MGGGLTPSRATRASISFRASTRIQEENSHPSSPYNSSDGRALA